MWAFYMLSATYTCRMLIAGVPIILAAISLSPIQQSGKQISILNIVSLSIHAPDPRFDGGLALQTPNAKTGISAATLSMWLDGENCHTVSFVFRPNAPLPKPEPASSHLVGDLDPQFPSPLQTRTADESVLIGGRKGFRHTESFESTFCRQVSVYLCVPVRKGLLEVECSILGQPRDIAQANADADTVLSSWKWTDPD